MGRVNVTFPDQLEERLRKWLVSQYGYKFKGKMSEHITKALEEYLDKMEGQEVDETDVS